MLAIFKMLIAKANRSRKFHALSKWFVWLSSITNEYMNIWNIRLIRIEWILIIPTNNWNNNGANKYYDDDFSHLLFDQLGHTSNNPATYLAKPEGDHKSESFKECSQQWWWWWQWSHIMNLVMMMFYQLNALHFLFGLKFKLFSCSLFFHCEITLKIIMIRKLLANDNIRKWSLTLPYILSII